MIVKTVLVVRKDLNLSKGKLIAQAAHSVFRASSDPLFTPSTIDYERTDTSQLPICIVCYVKSETALLELYNKMLGQVRCGLQVDSGHNEVPKGTRTALCLGPTESEAQLEFLNRFTKKLQLLKS